MKTEDRKQKLKDLEGKLKQLQVEASIQRSSLGGQPIKNGFENFVKQIFQRYE